MMSLVQGLNPKEARCWPRSGSRSLMLPIHGGCIVSQVVNRGFSDVHLLSENIMLGDAGCQL
jgi:hypothetical protein